MEGYEDIRSSSIDIRNEVDGEGSFSFEREIDKRASCVPCAGRIKIGLDKCVVEGRQEGAQIRGLLLRTRWNIGQDDGSFAHSSVHPVVTNVSGGSKSC